MAPVTVLLTVDLSRKSGRAGGEVLLLALARLGVWLIAGYRLRPAAALVLALGPALVLVSGLTALGECANLAAVAAFLLVVPPGEDRSGVAAPSADQLRYALLALRVGVGAALVVLAFTEKLTNPDMAVATVEQYPALDVFAWMELELAPTTFITIAGAVELLFGLLVISGALPQVAVLLVYGSRRDTFEAVRWLPRRPRSAVAADRPVIIAPR